MEELTLAQVKKQIFEVFQHTIKEKEITKPDFDKNRQEIITAMWDSARGMYGNSK